jgi:hypothetical protein
METVLTPPARPKRYCFWVHEPHQTACGWVGLLTLSVEGRRETYAVSAADADAGYASYRLEKELPDGTYAAGHVVSLPVLPGGHPCCTCRSFEFWKPKSAREKRSCKHVLALRAALLSLKGRGF